MPYGAFVDIGASTDGLVHVSQLADDFVKDIESVVKVGQEVQVRITEINAENNKVSLTMRSENARPQGGGGGRGGCLLYTSPSPRDGLLSRMPSSA